jgi:cytochrome c-type biogenesis protein CcmH/NrfG
MSTDGETDFLLRSLDDLDAEHEAGDLTDEQYEQLRNRYTVRAAERLRGQDEPTPARAHRRRRWWWVLGVGLLATLSGLMLARSVGARGPGTSLTGSGGSLRDQLAECQPLAFSDPEAGVACYDRILRREPENVEALTYRGWALVRSGRTDEAQRVFDRVIVLDSTYPDVFVFRAVVQKNRGDFTAAQAELDRLYALDPPAGILTTMSRMGLDREIAFGLLRAPTRQCWKDAEEAAQQLSRSTGGDDATRQIAEAITCLAEVSRADPTDLDALLARGYLLGVAGGEVLAPEARRVLDRAVELAPQNPTARLLRAALANTNGDPVSAAADLEVLEKLQGRPSPLFPVASPERIRADVDRQLSGTTTTTP